MAQTTQTHGTDATNTWHRRNKNRGTDATNTEATNPWHRRHKHMAAHLQIFRNVSLQKLHLANGAAPFEVG